MFNINNTHNEITHLINFRLIFLVLFSWSSLLAQSVPEWAGEKVTKDLPELSLVNLKVEPPKFTFRLWLDNQVVEIGDSLSFFISYEQNLGRKGKKPREYHFSKIVIKQPEQKALLKALYQHFILAYPSDSEISNWDTQLEGKNYLVEMIYNKQYSFKTYRSPELQEDLPQANEISIFIEELRKMLRLESNYKAFFRKLPKGCYDTGEKELVCKE